MIPFNKPYLHGKELVYISQSVASGKISGDGMFTKLCHTFFENKYKFKKALLTTSCTDALEMAAILLDIAPGDEVIAPAYTFVSSVNAFVLRGAKIVFADSSTVNPNIDPKEILALITPRTKAIIIVHYAGVACDMEEIMRISQEYNIPVVEDAAQCIDSYYMGKPLGSIGTFGTFSFHETKNIIAGEGGLLVINDEKYINRAEIIREKGTNRSSFFRGEVDKYGWVDIGSSFLPSDIVAAYLYAQLENMETIQQRRKQIWNKYYSEFKDLEIQGHITRPHIPAFASNNAHMFYLICKTLKQREELIAHLKNSDIHSVFHYISLHSSPYFNDKHDGRILKNSDMYTDCLLRLPIFYELTDVQLDYIINSVKDFFHKKDCFI